VSLWFVRSDYRLGLLVAAPSRGRARYLYLLEQRRVYPSFTWRDIARCVLVRRRAGHPEGVVVVA
jgi:hypothetical protein